MNSVVGPRCYGPDSDHQHRYAVACRSSAFVLDREGHPQAADELRRRAAAADRAGDQVSAAAASIRWDHDEPSGQS